MTELPPRHRESSNMRGLVGLAAAAMVVVVLAGLSSASEMVSLTLLGLMLAIAVLPVHQFFRARRAPDWLASLAASGALLLIAGGFGVLLAFATSQLAKELPRFQSSFSAFQEQIQTLLVNYRLDPLLAMLDRAGDLSQFSVLPRIFEAATSMGSVGFVLFVALFAIFEAPTFEAKWASLTRADPNARAKTSKALTDVQRYLLVKTAMCMATGLLVGIWTAAMGLDAAILWGLLAFALNYVPFLGSLIAGIPPTLVALLTLSPLTAALVSGGIFGINLLIGNLVEPRVMGRAMGLSPLVVLLSVAVWGGVLGPVGALLSVPLTVIVKLVLERNARYGWIAVLLDSPAALRRREPKHDGRGTEANETLAR